MSNLILRLKLGQIVEAKLVEILADKEYILSFEGNLLRVKHRTESDYKLGDKIKLVLQSLHPIKFVFVEDAKAKRMGRINVRV